MTSHGIATRHVKTGYGKPLPPNSRHSVSGHKKVMWWIFVFVLSTFFLAYNSRSSIAFYPGPIYGAGNVSCGKWLKDRKSGDYSQELGWVQGFLTAVGVSMNMGQLDKDGTVNYIDKYCQDKPTDILTLAVVAMVKELNVEPEK